jgi:hypothetical protein
MKKLFSFLIAVSSLYSSAQQTVVLNAEVVSSQFDKFLTPLPVFKFTSAHITLNNLQGNKKMVKLPVILPEFSQETDTGYFFLYSGINENGPTKGYITVVVSNCCNNKDAYLYVDLNANLNFTDDGSLIRMPKDRGYVDISLTEADNPARNVTYRLSRFNFFGKDTYFSMLDEFYRKEEKGRVFAGIRNSFREQRLNCKGGDYNSGADSFRVGLFDANNNGLYNDKGVDRFLVADYKSQLLAVEIEKGAYLIPEKGDLQVERNGNVYLIKTNDVYGNSIVIVRDSNAIAQSVFIEGQRLPPLKFNSWDNKKIRLRRISRKHPVYIHVVQFPYDNFQQDTAIFVQLLKKHPDLRIIWLQYGGKANNVNIIAQLPNVTWYMGHTNLKMNRKMRVNKYPFGILLRPKRKVLAFNCNTTELHDLLHKQLLEKAIINPKF